MIDSFYIKGRLVWSIVWFRLQAALGTLLGITAVIYPTILTGLDPKYLAVFVVLNALGQEWLRRRKTEDE